MTVSSFCLKQVIISFMVDRLNFFISLDGNFDEFDILNLELIIQKLSKSSGYRYAKYKKISWEEIGMLQQYSRLTSKQLSLRKCMKYGLTW